MQATWRGTPTVRVDSLKKGFRFQSSDGHMFTYICPDQGISGLHHVESDGRGSMAVPGAAVVVLVGSA